MNQRIIDISFQQLRATKNRLTRKAPFENPETQIDMLLAVEDIKRAIDKLNLIIIRELKWDNLEKDLTNLKMCDTIVL